MTNLVTGAAGFIGSAICRRLVADGQSVTGVDSYTDYYDVNIKKSNISDLMENDKFTFLNTDLLHMDLNALLENVDTVYHQAGQPGVRKSWGLDFRLYIDANISATQKLLEAAANSNIKKFVYASSSSIYGDAQIYPTSEIAVAQPLSPYGVTKLAAEHLCTLYAKNYNVPTVSLRYFTVYGPGQRPDMAFTKFCFKLLADEPLPLYGSGDQIRDFTYVEDIVSANIAAASGDTRHGAVFNVAGGSNASMLHVIDIMTSISGKRLRIDRSPAVAGDVRRTGGDISSIQRELSWRPTVTLEEGLERQYKWAELILSRGGSR